MRKSPVKKSFWIWYALLSAIIAFIGLAADSSFSEILEMLFSLSAIFAIILAVRTLRAKNKEKASDNSTAPTDPFSALSKYNPAPSAPATPAAAPSVSSPTPNSSVELVKLNIGTIPNLRKIKSYTVIDLETTGLDQLEDDIVEIGILHVEDGAITGTYTQLVNPGWPIPAAASEKHGIYDKDVAQAPRIKDLTNDLVEHLSDTVVVGYNVRYDLSFIKRALEAAGIEMQVQYGDILPLTKRAFPMLQNYKLITVARHLKLAKSQGHRGLDDAILAQRVYESCRTKILDDHQREREAKHTAAATTVSE